MPASETSSAAGAPCRPGLGRRAVLLGAAGLAAGGLGGHATQAGASPPRPWEPSRIALVNAHTGERFSGVYRDAVAPLQVAMARISVLLRDHRTGGVQAIEPALVDVLAELARRIGGGEERDITWTVLSGYRSRETNDLMARTDPWVALDSLHIYGRAIDIRIDGMPLAELRDVALDLRRGGVGYYPTRGFVHLDTGAVRAWVRPAGAES